MSSRSSGPITNMKKGFSLIESIIVITLLGLMFSGIAIFIQESINSWLFFSTQKELLSEATGAMSRMTRELRLADKNVNIIVYTTTQVTIRDVQGNEITFAQDGAYLKRNNDILAGNLTVPGGLYLRYLKEDGTDASNMNAVRSIWIRLTMVRENSKVVLESSAKIRIKKL